MSLERELTVDNLKGFVGASASVADFLAQKINNGYKNVLIPSRGAYPFYEQAFHHAGMYNMAFLDEDLQGTDDWLKIPKHNVITIPFTSDSCSEDNKPEEMRNFWVNVYKGLHSGKDNAASLLYKFTLENVAKIPVLQNDTKLFVQKKMKDYLPDLDSSSGTIFIDTVVSGRAASKILRSMDEQEIDYTPILLVDENGNKFDSKFKYELENRVNRRDGKIVYVPRIFTEDRGPSLVGVTSLIFPDFMEEVSKISQLKDIGINFPGAGIWFDIPIDQFEHQTLDEACEGIDKQKLHTTHRSFRSMFEYFMYHEYGIDNAKSYENFIMDFLKQANSIDILDKNTTLKWYESGLKTLPYKIGKVDVSSSHVIKVDYDSKKTKELAREFERSLRNL